MQIEQSIPANLLNPNSALNLYNEFKLLLERVKTFDHLVFYNRRLINVYMLTSYGFYRNISRDGFQQAKCANCGYFFLLDPIVHTDILELKESFNQVIAEHQQNCRYSIKERGGNSILKLNRLTILQFGTKLFKEILNQNTKKQQVIKQLYSSKLNISDIFINNKHQSMLNSLAFKQNISNQVYVLSIFGWKASEHSNLSCQYCGQMSNNSKQFDIYESHRTYCAILKQNYWEPILQKLTVDSLQKQNGEYSIQKTQGQVRARSFRQQLTLVAADTLNYLRNFELRIKGIKQSVIKSRIEYEAIKQNRMEDQNQNTQLRQYLRNIELQNESKYQQKGNRRVIRFNKLVNFSKEMSEYINNSIKKIKLQ